MYPMLHRQGPLEGLVSKLLSELGRPSRNSLGMFRKFRNIEALGQENFGYSVVE
jgi:hypothetical protein